MTSNGKTESGDDFEYVADESEFKENDRIIVDIKGREIAVFYVEGEYHAISNYCVHQGGPVCEGLRSGSLSVDEELELDYDLEDRIVACPWHGWEFNITTGEHLARPNYRLATYKTIVKDGGVYLDI